MGKKNIIIVVIVIAILLIGGYFFISSKNKDNPKVVSLTIENVTINDTTMNNRLSLTGTVDITVDESIYDGVSLEGYCLDTNNTRYSIYGPQDGRSLFHNGSSDLSLSEDLDEVNNVDWENITIKYCKIDTMKTYKSNDGLGNLTSLAETKEFKLNYEKSFN